ncbi:MAG TPA: MOSC domain-containing protein [Phycisphaerae bacterium]|nr:MOSC domain-containing protein [Phycisphaerae bacterium]
MNTPALLSIQIGKPQSYGSDSATNTHDKPWTTGFFKAPITGPIFASHTHLDGDGQADLKHHGGPDKAILAYSADHYHQWQSDINRELPFGAFGENLTIAGLSEETVHIGDLFSIGSVLVEVSQPRQPCWKLARRWRMNELVPMVINNGRTGWYLRVLREGLLEAGMPVQLLQRPNPDWPVSRANRILHHHKKDLDLTLQLAAVPKLAGAWTDELLERAARLRESAPV